MVTLLSKTQEIHSAKKGLYIAMESILTTKFDGILGLGIQQIPIKNAVPVWYSMEDNCSSNTVVEHQGSGNKYLHRDGT